MSASRHTMLALPYTHLNTVLGRLLCIYAFKTIDALWTLNDISKPGPDKPLRISAFGRFWWLNLASFGQCVKARQGLQRRGSFHIIGAAFITLRRFKFSQMARSVVQRVLL